jgi:hypothetical protein
VVDIASRVQSCRAASTIGNQIHASLGTDSWNFVSRLMARPCFETVRPVRANRNVEFGQPIQSRWHKEITVSNFIADYFEIRR